MKMYRNKNNPEVTISVEDIFDQMSNREKKTMLNLLRQEYFSIGYLEIESRKMTYTESEFYDILKNSWNSRIHIDPVKVKEIRDFFHSLNLF